MAWVFKTLIVPASVVEAARNMGECLAPTAAGMFTTPLSPTGALPATHYISSGLIGDEWLAPLSDPQILYAAAQQGASAQGLTLTATAENAAALLAQSDISEDPPGAVLARMGLQQITEPA